MKHYDIAVIGAGMVGASCALALQRQGFGVALIDQQTLVNMPQALPHTRVSAINDASYQLLQDLGVWQRLHKERITPILAMKIFAAWQDASSACLDFTAAEFGFAELGFILENHLLTQALLDQFNAQADDFYCPYQIERITREGDWHIELKGAQPITFTAKLLVIAQGATSMLREALGVNSEILFYQQKALVLNLRSEIPHRFTAFQRFLPTGPIAFLPLFEPHLSSIVWTLPTALADEYVKLAPEALMLKLFEVFPDLGALEALTPAMTFELTALRAERYYGPGFVLVGDSAHTVHPLAGQGVNIGLQDVRSLGKVLRQGLSDQALAQYERACQLRNKHLAQGFTLLNRLFQLEQRGFQRILGMGLRSLNRLHGVKRQLIEVARGWMF